MNVTKTQFVSIPQDFINVNAVLNSMEMIEFAKMRENKKLSDEENEFQEITCHNEYPHTLWTIIQL